jgi:toxin ParE1/3/4
MLQLIRSLQSIEDQIAIWRYIAAQSPAAADRLIDQIEERIDSVLPNPEIGERQTQFGANTWRVIVGNYLDFYEVLPNAIHVLRIFHAARKLEDLFD